MAEDCCCHQWRRHQTVGLTPRAVPNSGRPEQQVMLCTALLHRHAHQQTYASFDLGPSVERRQCQAQGGHFLCSVGVLLHATLTTEAQASTYGNTCKLSVTSTSEAVLHV